MSLTAADSIPALEIELLLEAIYRRYGYDFQNYRRETLAKRIARFQADHHLPELSTVIGRVLREPALFFNLMDCFSINVTALFRDPWVWAALRQQVLPHLRTWPHIKVWNAGCATGEEVYSMAILLLEEGLLPRSMIYATDINTSALQTAREGIYPLKIIRQGSRNYLESSPRAVLADYYHARYQGAVMDGRLRRAITFARHNLAMEASFGEMQVIICRNVLIYFNHTLQQNVLRLFWNSLEHGGFLCLGDKESLAFSQVADGFEIMDRAARIYRKRLIAPPDSPTSD